MAGDTTLTIIGNLTSAPELRFTPSGAAVANFTVASTPRQFDKATEKWVDQETLFMRCSIWRDAAENATESLDRGMRVIVTGRLKSRSYETREGEKRTVVEMDVDEIGPSLKNATAKVHKTERTKGGGGWSSPAADDPWATPRDPGQSAWGGENSGQPIQGRVQTPPQGGWPGAQDPSTWGEPPFAFPPTVIS